MDTPSDTSERANGTPDEQAWANARFRARVLAPAVAAVVSPLILAAVLAVLLGPQAQEFLRFRDFVLISLFFTPAIAAVTAWQARILTDSKPLNEHALTGISALMGVLLNLVALAFTLTLAGVGLFIYVANNFDLPPEILVEWVLRILAVVVLVFLMLSPHFMIVGAVIGLVTAAVVHHSYRPGWLPSLGRLQFAIVTLLLLSAVLALYIAICIPRVDPEPETAASHVESRATVLFDPGVGNIKLANPGTRRPFNAAGENDE